MFVEQILTLLNCKTNPFWKNNTLQTSKIRQFCVHFFRSYIIFANCSESDKFICKNILYSFFSMRRKLQNGKGKTWSSNISFDLAIMHVSISPSKVSAFSWQNWLCYMLRPKPIFFLMFLLFQLHPCSNPLQLLQRK